MFKEGSCVTICMASSIAGWGRFSRHSRVFLLLEYSKRVCCGTIANRNQTKVNDLLSVKLNVTIWPPRFLYASFTAPSISHRKFTQSSNSNLLLFCFLPLLRSLLQQSAASMSQSSSVAYLTRCLNQQLAH